MDGNYFLIAAFFIGIIGSVPLFLRKRFVAGPVVAVLSFLVTWFLLWAVAPSTVYPFWGPVGFMILIVWGISAAVDGLEDGATWTTLVPVAGAGIWAGSFFVAWAALGSNDIKYASVIGPIEERVWTQDVQPKDPRHMLMVSKANADYLAKKAVAQGGTIGSQFSLNLNAARLQRVHGELVYVYPLDFKSYSTWSSSKGVPAYIIVYAEDPERLPHLVNLSASKYMLYTPDAFFGYDLERHMRNNGFLNDGLADFHLELNENEEVFWVVTTYAPTITWFAEKVTGVAVVDPRSGKIERYSVENAPAWIDRIYPDSFVKDYLDWHGHYARGWWNKVWVKFDITQPEEPTLIYGEGDKAEFVVGMTSNNEKDDSLVGLMYVDSRTGKTVYYTVNGGGTDKAIIQAVNSNASVKYLHLRATIPQIYNVYGHMAAVVPTINDTGAYQGVAIVSVTNVQDVAFGRTQSEAFRSYQSLAARQGQQIAVEKASVVKKLTGVIDRINQEANPTGNVYFFHVEGAPRIFTASSADYVKLTLTKVGDTVVVEYVASGETTVPVKSFDNASLPLDMTAMQGEVERAAQARATAETSRNDALDLSDRIKTMKPEELKRLRDLLRTN